jgi:hypothetical protein
MKLFKMAWSFLFLGYAGVANAQLMCSLGHAPSQQYNPTYDTQPSLRAASELKTIYQALCPSGCGQYFLVSNRTTPNASASAVRPGVSKLAYNPGFLNQVAGQYGGGATFGILSHEFGHHIDFHTTPPWMNNSWSRELKADAWAGCALARVGGNTQEIENSLRAIAAYPSSTHPGWQQRHHAVRVGFTNCGGRWTNRFNLSSATPRRSPAPYCQTQLGQCPLMGQQPVGSGCSCSTYNQSGQEIRRDSGVAR